MGSLLAGRPGGGLDGSISLPTLRILGKLVLRASSCLACAVSMTVDALVV